MNCRIVFGPTPNSSDADSDDGDAHVALSLNSLHLVRLCRLVCTEIEQNKLIFSLHQTAKSLDVYLHQWIGAWHSSIAAIEIIGASRHSTRTGASVGLFFVAGRATAARHPFVDRIAVCLVHGTVFVVGRIAEPLVAA